MFPGWKLPDVASVVAHHLVSLFAIKGLGKVRAVLHRANHAELTRRVRIHLGQQTRAFVRLVLAPHLGKAEPETLLSCEALLGLAERGIVLNALAQRNQSNVAAAVVCGVFAEGEPPIEMNVVNRRELAVFICNAAGTFFKLCAVGVSPPVAEVAFSIKLATLVVKAMGQFVANDYANAAEVHSSVCSFVKERRLQDSGREVDVIIWRAVVGIHGGWAHAPLFLVERLADFIPVAMNLESAGALGITKKIAALDDDCAVVTPFVGVADLVGDGLQLYFRFFLGFRSHPVKALDIIAQGGLQFLNHLQHAVFTFLAEGFIDIRLTQGFAKKPVGGLDAALPAGLQLLLATKILAEEFKIGVDEFVGKHGRSGIHYMPAQVGLPVSNGNAVNDRVYFLKEVRRHHVDIRKAGRAGIREKLGKFKVRRQFLKFADGHFVVASPRIAHFNALISSVSQFAFYIHHCL